MTTTGVVLAAGASRRLGRPKQLLPFEGGTLLDATLRRVRECGFDQVIVTIGAAADEVLAAVDLSGVRVVRNTDPAGGCSSSLAAALPHVDDSAEGLVLLLGDQPLVAPFTVRALVAATAGATIGACCYLDGIGHPFWLGRKLFGELAGLHGDKGVWKLISTAGDELVRLPVGATVPIDVDTWADFERLQASVRETGR